MIVSSQIFVERLAGFEHWLWTDGFTQLGFGAAPSKTDLAHKVATLSDLYTTERAHLGDQKHGANHPVQLPAKLGFFLCSDAPKVHLVLAELERRGAFSQRGRNQPLRALDLGAGVGTATVGLLLSLDAKQVSGLVVRGVDADPAALEIWRTVAQQAASLVGLEVDLMPVTQDLETGLKALSPAGFDWVLIQSLLNELFVDVDSSRRIGKCAAWLQAALAGDLTIAIEPALRGATRSLHQCRDFLVSQGSARVLAPCPHQQACPMLARERDWCHERRIFPAAAQVAALQRLTRRRDQRLNFSFVVFQKPGQFGPPARLPAGAGRLVSDALRSKGKTERLLCGCDGELHRLRLLKRDETTANRLLISAERGELIQLSKLHDPPRVSTKTRVEALPQGGTVKSLT
jgi:ribosomal protein RSM22 (predicted rRNA methylase)